MVKKKTTKVKEAEEEVQEEFEEVQERDEEVVDDTVEVETPPASSVKKRLPPTPEYSGDKANEVEELEKKLALAKMNQAKKNFMVNAPQRLRDCEVGIEENRNFIIKMNESLTILMEQVTALFKKK